MRKSDDGSFNEGSVMSFRSILLRVLFWSLALAAIFGALGILFAAHDTIWRTAATSISTAGAALLLLAALSVMDKPGFRPASLLAITLIVVEYLLTLGAIWDLGPSGYRYVDPLNPRPV